MSASLTRPSHCPLDCPDGCSLDVTVTDGRVTAVDGSWVNPLTAGFICGKVRSFADHVYHPTRLLHPELRDGPKGSGRFRRATWDEALDVVAERMRAVAATSGAEAVLPFCYGGSNGKLTHDSVDARLFRRLGASRLLRTVCAAPTGAAAQALYGKMLGVALPDYVHARLVVVWGTNPHATGIHLVPFLKRAREGGTRLVVVDPRRTKLAKQADLHLPLLPGTDLPLALALVRWLFENGAADQAFLARHASGAEGLRERAAPWTLERAAETCGLARDDLEAFARLYADSCPAVIRCGWGLERNRNAGSAVAAVLALPAVAGKFGVRGGGYTMSQSRAWSLSAAGDEPQPATRAVNMNRLGRALLGELDGPPIELLFVYNANPLATLPDQERVRRGLVREDLFTVVFEQVRTDTARFADVLLPATTFLEHHDLAAGYAGFALQHGAPVIEPVGEARPNYAVFAELSRRLGLARPGDAESAEELLDVALSGRPEVREALARDGVAYPPEGDRPVQFLDVFPRTPDGRARLFPDELDREAPCGLYVYAPDPATAEHPLALISPATERTISSSLGQLVEGEVALGLHPDDARARGIEDGDRVRVYNALGAVETSARLDPDLRPGLACLPKGLWSHNTRNGSTANALAPDTLTDVAGGACFNDARVEVELSGKV